MTARSRGWHATIVAAAIAITTLAGGGDPRAALAQDGVALRGPEAFASIVDRTQRSIALFVEAGKVFQHPRCRNCHAGDDRARQGDEGVPHQPAVRRGADGLGAPGLRCPACHQDANYDAVGMPGLAGWSLAPASMGLRALPLSGICVQLKDPDKNGSRSIDDLITHVTNDALVIWAWAPGKGRRPPPGTHGAFAALIRAWAETGAECPRVP
jgi:hypothetical protein